MDTPIEALFAQAECDGQLCVQALDGSGAVAVRADEPVVAASVIKVPIALAVETQFAEGRLDPCERVTLTADSRSPGPTGFSLFQDDVDASLRDLVVAMLTVSDNHATDVLLHRVGIDAVNAGMARLGLTGTVIEYDTRTLVNSIGQDAGFTDWAAMIAWSSQPHTQTEAEDLERRVLTASALRPARTTRTTSRDMVTLLRLIWSDQAGPAPACSRVRQIMRQQLTKHRLASAFPPPAGVAAKSGGLMGVVRNEIGVITHPDGWAYAAAVFTSAHRPGHSGHTIDAVIGTAAAAAITALNGVRGVS
jgi:beta-lactamase class A